MAVKRRALAVRRRDAERLRRILIELNLLDDGFRPFERGGLVYFPVVGKRVDALKTICGEFGATITSAEFEERVFRPRNLKEALADKLQRDLLQMVPSSYLLIGDLILIELPERLRPYEKLIGEALMRLHPRIKTVLAKSGVTTGLYRVRDVRVIAGSGETETIHRENKCIYKLDLRKVFFNPRFSGERLRVARMVSEGEYVLDMFAGIGSFSILIAKNQPSAKVFAIELNPDAYRFMLENIRINRVEERVRPFLGDAREILKTVQERFDRVIMDLPHESINFLGVALRKLKPRGTIHLYMVSEGEDALAKASKVAQERAREEGYDVRTIYSRKVMEIAPRMFTVVLDLRLR